jgi:RND family efflux transporter MFP subunit
MSAKNIQRLRAAGAARRCTSPRGGALATIIIILVVLGALAAGGVFYFRPVAKVIKVARGKAANVVPGSVIVDAARESSITSEVEGKILTANIEPGNVVKEGEVLVQLDTADIDLEIAHAKSEYEAAKASQEATLAINKQQWQTKEEELETAKREHTLGRLPDQGFAQAERAFDVAKQTRAKLEADDKYRVESLLNTLQVAQRKREKMTIRAPFDGTISTVLARKNDFIGAKQPIANIIAQARIVRAKISEENFAAIKVGDPAVVSFLGYRGEVFKATVTQKLPTAEPDTQRYTVYLKVEIPNEKLLPNLTGDVGITVGERTNALLVPSRAMWDGYVRVVENGRAFERKLKTGYADLNMVEVTDGLKEGDLVVVEQPDKFEDGQRVRVEMAR